eukprot:420997-Rhodomonas_salina.2
MFYHVLPLNVSHPFSKAGGDCTEGDRVEECLCLCQVMTQSPYTCGTRCPKLTCAYDGPRSSRTKDSLQASPSI